MSALPMFLAFVAAAVVLFRVMFLTGVRQGTAGGWRGDEALKPWIMGLALAVICLVLLLLGRGLAAPGLLFGGVALAYFALWVRDFSLLMQMPDTSFNGRNDKLIWAVVLILLGPFGILAFWNYRRGRQTTRSEKPEPISGLREFP